MNKSSLMGLTLFVAVALIAAGTFIASQRWGAPPAEGIVVLDKTDPSGVRCWVALGPGGRDVNIRVRYDDESRPGAAAYIAWNKSEAARLLNTRATKFWVIVNFNGPQPREAFERFVRDYHMEVVEYSMRAIEPPTSLTPKGNRVTAMGAPYNGALIPDDLFNAMLRNVTGERGATLKGWITVRGGVDREGFQKLQSDPRVAVVEEVSHHLALQRHGSPRNPYCPMPMAVGMKIYRHPQDGGGENDPATRGCADVQSWADGSTADSRVIERLRAVEGGHGGRFGRSLMRCWCFCWKCSTPS